MVASTAAVPGAPASPGLSHTSPAPRRVRGPCRDPGETCRPLGRFLGRDTCCHVGPVPGRTGPVVRGVSCDVAARRLADAHGLTRLSFFAELADSDDLDRLGEWAAGPEPGVPEPLATERTAHARSLVLALALHAAESPQLGDAAARRHPELTARFGHDCDRCRLVSAEGVHDVYVCAARPEQGSVVARASADPSDCASLPVRLLGLQLRDPGHCVGGSDFDPLPFEQWLFSGQVVPYYADVVAALFVLGARLLCTPTPEDPS